MSVSSVSASSKYWSPFWNGTKKAANQYVHFAFGEGASIFEKSLRPAIKENGFNGFWGNFKTAWNQVPTTGGKQFFVDTYNNLIKPSSWSATWKELGAAGKGFWGKLGGTVGKRLPLIGSALIVLGEIPNAFRAFTHPEGGLGTGIVEVGKAAGKIGAFSVGAAVGQALIPIPLVGALVGGIVGGFLGERLFGKSFSEKQTEKKQAAAQNLMAAGAYSIPSNDFEKMYNNYMAQQAQISQMYGLGRR